MFAARRVPVLARRVALCGAPLRHASLGSIRGSEGIPCGAPYADTYYTRTALLPAPAGVRVAPWSARAAASSRDDVDVCVVGGGLAGLNVALSLVERRPTARVAVLEANRVGWGASGRNGGFVHAGFSIGDEGLVARCGVDTARALYGLTDSALDLIRARIKRYAIDAGSLAEGMVTCSWFDDEAGTRSAVERTNGALGTRMEFWDRGRVRATYATSRYYDAVYDPRAFQLHPLNYCLGLSRVLTERYGASVYEGARVSRIVAQPSGRTLVEVNRGASTFVCDHVVLAGSGYMADLPLSAALNGATLPVKTYVMQTEPLGHERMRSVMKAAHCVTDNRFACDYYRPLDDSSILWGGRIDSIAIPEDRIAHALKTDMLRVFPQLSDVRVAAAWSGVMGYSMHKMPLLGRLSTGAWYCTNFGGHGLCPTTMAGEVIADAMLHSGAGPTDALRLFERFGLTWTGGRVVGKLGAQAMYTLYQLRDLYKETLQSRSTRSR